MDFFAKTQQITGKHPAIERARGDALQRTFHNKEAMLFYLEAAKLADDDRIWRSLAVSAGSIGKAKIAYWAARNGLALEPRDPHLLRNQMLSLRKLDAPKKEQKAALHAFGMFKRDEQAAAIKDRCQDDNVDCQRERVPIVPRMMHTK